MADDVDRRLTALESRIQEVEALANLALRLLAVEKPVSAVLERYGATEAEDLAVHAVLDDVARRAELGGMYAPSFGGFLQELAERYPASRDNRELVSLILETLKVDRPAYRQVYAYASSQGWPQW